MSDPIPTASLQAADEGQAPTPQETAESAPAATLDWQTPQLEDVSEQVMAQPYIRFT